MHIEHETEDYFVITIDGKHHVLKKVQVFEPKPGDIKDRQLAAAIFTACRAQRRSEPKKS